MPRHLAVLAACAALIAAPALHGQTTDSTGPGPMIELRSKGDTAAPITVYEMSDFQCPFCRQFFTETFPSIEKDYVASGKVHWVFVNFPLTELHPNAEPAAEFAMCAAKRGKFWPVHDLLYRHQDLWAPLKDPGAFLMTLADSVGIPRDSLRPCLVSHEMQGRVAGDAATATRAGARATPSFYIEGALLSGAYPSDVFHHVLDSIYVLRRGTAK